MKLNKKFKESSKNWIIRQMKDPYVKKAKEEGFLSRAAFKLIEINEKEKLIKQGMKILDLGAAPGGWLQVASKIVKETGVVVGVDLLEISHISNNVKTFATSFEDFSIENFKQTHLISNFEKFNGILSDMAPSSCGVKSVDNLRLVSMLESASNNLSSWLLKDGFFVAKVLQGGADLSLLKQLKTKFKKITHFKPKSSRSNSCEMYLVAKGFLEN